MAQLVKKLAKWTYIHLLVSTYSFLILSCWGIAFCPMSFIGNLIFGPVLTLFLALSALTFFTELCFIPNSYIVSLLDLLSNGWLTILKSASIKHLQIPCAQPPIICMCTVFLATFIIMVLRTSYLKKNTYLCFALLMSFLLAKQQIIKTNIDQLPCANSHIHIIKHAEQLIIVDPGCLGRYISAPSFVQFTLMPHLINRYGTNVIDHLILLQPGKLTFDAVQAITEKGSIKNLYIPLWHGQLSKSGLISFMRMKEKIQEQQTQLCRLNKHTITLIKNATTSLSITPIEKLIKKGSITFRAFRVGDIIDKQSITIYPSKYK